MTPYMRYLRARLWLSGMLLRWSIRIRAGVRRDLDRLEIADPWNLPVGHPQRTRWEWRHLHGDQP